MNLSSLRIMLMLAAGLFAQVSQGCPVLESKQQASGHQTSGIMKMKADNMIMQILLKPASGVVLDDKYQLPPEYLAKLQSTVAQSVSNTLLYVRPMSLGVHVLKVEPAVSSETAEALSAALSERNDVEYAEPDSLRKRR